MSLTRFWTWLRGCDTVTSCDDGISVMTESVTFVRPESTPSSTINTELKNEWMRNQQSLGRYIVSDSQFKSGGGVRSIPHLDDGKDCVLLRKRRQMQQNQRGGFDSSQEGQHGRDLGATS